MAAKAMRAQYRGRCVKCPQAIKPGDEIMYDRTAGSWHASCPAEPAVSGARPQVSEAADLELSMTLDGGLSAATGFTAGPR